MAGWRDRLNRLSGKNRIVVCRVFIHLRGRDVAPLLGVLNSAARQAVDSEGDLEVLGAGLVRICESLLDYETYWHAVANEGEVLWDEGDAADLVTELFTDSAQRYGSGNGSIGDESGEAGENLDDLNDESFSLPVSEHTIVMITIAYEGEVPALETDLASVSALRAGLKAMINLHYDERLRAIQVHFSPAQLGDELTSDHLLLHYPELVPL